VRLYLQKSTLKKIIYKSFSSLVVHGNNSLSSYIYVENGSHCTGTH